MKKGKIFAICIVVCLILIFAVYSNKKVKGVKLFGFAKPEKMTIEMEIGSVRNKVMADKDKEKFISYLNNAGYKKVKSELIEGVSVLYKLIKIMIQVTKYQFLIMMVILLVI